MKAITMIASDIDGTLVGDDSVLPDTTCRVLQALLAEGIAVTLVTGMNPWAARRYVQQIGPAVRVICQNGIVLLENDTLTEGAYTPVDIAQRAIALIIQHGYVPLVYGEDGISRYLNVPSPGLDRLHQLMADRPYQPFEEVSSPTDLLTIRPAQVSVCDTAERTTKLYPVLQQALGDRAYVIHQPATRSWLEVNHPQARKDTALLALAKRLGITQDEIVYFGDNYNDLPVFEQLSHCVAMGNAQPEIKAIAWQIAPPQQEQGVAALLRSLFPGMLAED